MNKFLAMLKDSFREAIDGWIFYVMLALAALFIVLVFSASVTPVAADRAITRMIAGDAVRIVSPDRGTSDRMAQFFFNPSTTNVKASNAGKPWDGPISFTVTFESSMFGGMEVDDTGKKPTKPVEGAGLLSDALREAARYWAAPANTPARERPKYTEKLGAEFLQAQVGAATGLNITKVTPVGESAFAFEANGLNSKVNWPHSPSLFFGALDLDTVALPLGKLVFVVENGLLNGIGAWVLMLAGVVVTAGFIPNMLRKGAIDLFITKPMSRPFILICKYLGGLLFVYLICVVTVGGVWIAIGVRTGLWSPGVLATIFGITFYFAILYACSTLFGVLSRNAIVCIVVTIVFWFILYLVGVGYNTVMTFENMDFSEMQQSRQASQSKKPKSEKKDGDKKAEEKPKDEEPAEEPPPPMPDMKPHPTLVKVMKTLNAVTPRLNDVDVLTTQAIGRGLLPEAEHKINAKAGKKVEWGEVLGVSCAWIALFLGLATLRFCTRSY